MNGDGDFDGFATGKDRASDTSPHRLDKMISDAVEGAMGTHGESGVGQGGLLSRCGAGESAPDVGRAL